MPQSLADRAHPKVGGRNYEVVFADGTRQRAQLVGKQPINNFSDLNSYLVFNTTVGQTIEVTVLRNGEPTVLFLTLGARP